MLKWIDNTSYRQGERGKIQPNNLKSEVNGFEIVIHRHRHYEDTWLLTCYKLQLEQVDLETNDFDEAENKAIKIIVNKLDLYTKLKDELIQFIK